MTIEVKVPGKLFIAGEYSVVNSGYSSILTEVNRYMTIKISKGENKINAYNKEYSFNRESGKIILNDELKYIKNALEIFEDYLSERGLKVSNYNIEIDSKLDSNDGIKYGFGSSGAVTIGIIKGLNKFYKTNLTDLEIYKLGVISQLKAGIKSSFGDLALIAYGGTIFYNSPDTNQLNLNKNIHELLNKPWPNLNVKRLNWPENLFMTIGWTSEAADTLDLVNLVEEETSKSKDRYENFLTTSQRAVEFILSGFEDGNIYKIIVGIEMNEKALRDFATNFKLPLYTSELTQLIEIGNKYGRGKFSGAGGGDCGIIFTHGSEKIESLKSELISNGIKIIE